jgi:hypothetical protein
MPSHHRNSPMAAVAGLDCKTCFYHEGTSMTRSCNYTEQEIQKDSTDDSQECYTQQWEKQTSQS